LPFSRSSGAVGELVWSLVVISAIVVDFVAAAGELWGEAQRGMD
jgi:hypothetical protein